MASELSALLRWKWISRSSNSSAYSPEPCGVEGLWDSMADSELMTPSSESISETHLTAWGAEVGRLLSSTSYQVNGLDDTISK